ncbi:MAG: hypothetical protein ABI577_08110 [bacterium]
MPIRVLDDQENDDDQTPLGDDAPGPDERDLDLMDGSWEQEYYSGRVKTRNWNAIGAGIALLVLAGLLVPVIAAAFN